MPALLRLPLLVPLGFVVAIFAAGATVALGIGGAEASPDTQIWIAVVAAWAALYGGAFAFLPWLVAVVVAEGFGLRSIFYWFAVGGGLAVAGYVLNRVDGDPAVVDPGMVVTLAAGFVGGFTYWLIAGRLSGVGLAATARDSSRT
jgi:hypothetical protein